MNRKWVCKNPYQGEYKRVLCCCSAGVLRSPTAAEVISQKFGHNTRSCGVDAGHALIPIDEVLVEWADEIVCMTNTHANTIKAQYKPKVPVIVLNVPDEYEFRNPYLIKMIEERYAKHISETQAQDNQE